MTERLPIVRLTDVFVTANPVYTYSPRESEQLEAAITDHLDERDKVLMLTGPTKTGKTVLVDHVAPDAVKVEGPTVRTTDDLWREIVDQLEGYTQESRQASRTETEAGTIGANVEVNAGVIKGGLKQEDQGTTAMSATKSYGAERGVQRVGRDLLLDSCSTLVIDDFHHVNVAVQAEIVAQLKSVVAKRQSPLILIAVPHHAADVVRAEGEMQGRVTHIRVRLWDIRELRDIADRGFRVLNVDCSEKTATRLAEHAWGSPHLMQILCREIAKANGIRETREKRVAVEPPSDWDTFLYAVAVENTDHSAVEKLAGGAHPRGTRRKARDLREGGTSDLYQAMLAAIASTGPERELSMGRLREALAKVLVEMPQRHEITQVLTAMSRIAAGLVRDGSGRCVGDPVLEYHDDRLHVVDPFFAFRLRWGPSIITGFRESP